MSIRRKYVKQANTRKAVFIFERETQMWHKAEKLAEGVGLNYPVILFYFFVIVQCLVKLDSSPQMHQHPHLQTNKKKNNRYSIDEEKEN